MLLVCADQELLQLSEARYESSRYMQMLPQFLASSSQELADNLRLCGDVQWRLI